MTAAEARTISEIRQEIEMNDIFQTIKRAADRGENLAWIIKKKVTEAHTDELTKLGYRFLFDTDGDLRINW